MKTTILYLSLLFAFSLHAEPLEIGKPAPELKISHWVKNGPVKLADGKGKNIYVIEFWATWCMPCRMSIPHLSEIQKKYKDKGVVVVGISHEKLSDVDSFVKAQKNMNYNVAADPEGTTYGKYMSGIPGIPHAFIVDREGILVWSGHPMQMDRVLDRLVAGTFDPAMEEKTENLQKTFEDSLQHNDIKKGFETAKQLIFLKPNNKRLLKFLVYMFNVKHAPEEAKTFFDKLITAHPDKEQPYLAKLRFLTGLGDRKGAAVLADRYIEQFHDNAKNLDSIARILVTEIPLRLRLPAQALAAARQAVKVTPSDNKMLAGVHLATLARCYYEVGRLDKAIELQEKAVALMGDGHEAHSNSAILDYYKAAMRIGDSEK